MDFFTTFLARRPFVVLSTVLICSITCIITTFLTRPLPNFTDPTAGFEARGTAIGQRLTSWNNLMEETSGSSGLLVSNPNDFVKPTDLKKRRKQGKKRKDRKGPKVNEVNEVEEAVQYGLNVSFYDEDEGRKKAKNVKMTWDRVRKLRPLENETLYDFFCGAPAIDYAHFVVVHSKDDNKKYSNESLFTLQNILAICRLQQQMTETKTYRKICQMKGSKKDCCRPWSLPNYVALLARKQSCLDIQETDLEMVQGLLLMCLPFFENSQLSSDCFEIACRNTPGECARENAVFNILYHLTDNQMLSSPDASLILSKTMIFLPVARSSQVLDFYHELESQPLNESVVKIAAIDLGLKNALFDEYLFSDAWRVALGGCVIMLSMWFYTESVFVTATSLLSIFLSLGVAYFVYSVILRLQFFPFMNLLAIIVVVGIGSDDVFIIVKMWNNVKVPPSMESEREILQFRVQETLRTSAVSMFVSSITTSAAFFASFTSSITAVKCFGIFAGLAVLANYLFAITLIPASIIVSSKWRSCFTLNGKMEGNLKRAVSKLVLKIPVVFVLVLGTLGLVSFYIVFYFPKLRVPDTQNFQLFVPDHSFELYDSTFKQHFTFETSATSPENFPLPLSFVWGVRPVDNGNILDPSSRGELELDPTFNVSSPVSQLWLFNFCSKLQNQNFTVESPGLLSLNCFIQNLIQWMNRPCIDPMTAGNFTPCCESSTFPFPAPVFEMCLPQFIEGLYATPRQFFTPGAAGPKFLRENSSIAAMVVEFDSPQVFSMSHQEMHGLFEEVESWFRKIMASAPSEMRGGWFTSNLDFYNLQLATVSDTAFSIIVAMIIALVVVSCATLNVTLSTFAIISTTFTITTTVAVLVLLGWKLNILESIAVATAIGLAIDFNLHYSVHYRFSATHNRKSAVQHTVSQMLEPTCMAALTTIVAGAFMIPSQVLAYIQIGTFLVVIMITSWIYATFFLTSCLALFGPQKGFVEFKGQGDEQASTNESHEMDSVETNLPSDK